MPALTDAQWEEVRAIYTATTTSVRAIARQFGVDEGRIRQKARADSWVRDPRAAARILAEAEARTAEMAIAQTAGVAPAPASGPTPRRAPPHDRGPPPASAAPPHSAPRAESSAEGAEGAEGNPWADLVLRQRAALLETFEDARADLLARTSLDHLDRVARLKRLFSQYEGLLTDALQPVVGAETDADGEDGEARQAGALRILLNARSDTLSGHIQALVRTAEQIQSQERRALGMDDKAKRVELSGPGGAPIQTQSSVTLPDLSRLSTDDMERLWQAGLLIEGQQERPPIPMPPGEDEAAPGGGEAAAP